MSLTECLRLHNYEYSICRSQQSFALIFWMDVLKMIAAAITIKSCTIYCILIINIFKKQGPVSARYLYHPNEITNQGFSSGYTHNNAFSS